MIDCGKLRNDHSRMFRALCLLPTRKSYASRRRGPCSIGLAHLSFVLVVGQAGCSSGLRMRAPGVELIRSRTVVLPVTAESYDLDSDGDRLDQAARVKALENSLGVEFERQARAKGALPLSFDKVRACGDNCVSQLSTAIRWGARAAMEIAEAGAGANPSGKSSVEEWQSGRDLHTLQHAIAADLALVFYVRDVRWTAGRQFRDSFRPPIVRAIQGKDHDDLRRILVACALELASGQMVWCSAIVDRWVEQYVDMTLPKESRRLVKELLKEF